MESIEPSKAAYLINTIIFDLDGTLIDSIPGIYAALNVAFEAVGRTLVSTNLRTAVGPPIKEIAQAIEPSLSEVELVTIERLYRSVYDSTGWSDSLIYPEVAETLHFLVQEKIRMFVVTNKPKIPATQILAHLGINKVFKDTLSRNSRIPPYLDKAEMVSEIIDKWNIDRATTLMVGDTEEDFRAARANGITFGHATYGYGSVSPDTALVINKFSEILPIISASLPVR